MCSPRNRPRSRRDRKGDAVKCVICHRPLSKPAMTVPAKAGVLWVGPKCSRVIAPRVTRTQPARDSRAPRYRDGLTADLFEAASC